MTSEPTSALDEFEALTIPSPRPLEEEIIARASASHEPLPMLDVILARMGTSYGPSLKTSNGLLTEVDAPKIVYRPWGNVVSTLDVHGLTGIAKTSWGGSIAMEIDKNFLHGAIHFMMGGASSNLQVPERSATALERAFAQRLITQSLEELASHFSRITEVNFQLDTIEAQSQLSSLFAPSAMTACCEIVLVIGNLKGRLTIILPLQTLDPVTPQLSKMFLGEKLGTDSSWRDHFADQISGSMMPITVELHQLKVPLADILGWKPGATLDLGITREHEATVLCSGRAILRGATGRKRNGRMALRVTQEIGAEIEGGVSDDLLDD